MAKAGRQTFKKRDREMQKKQKREDKARRMAARRQTDGDQPAAETPKPEPEPEKMSSGVKDGKGKELVVFVRNRGRDSSDRR